MGLTDRGRVLCGVLATGLVVLAQQVVGGDGKPGARASAPARSSGSGSVAGTSSELSSAAPARRASPRPATIRTPSASATPAVASAPVFAGSGRLLRVEGSSDVGGHGPLRRYRVEVEAGIAEDGEAFAAAVQSTLTDPRSWGRDLSFQRVDSGSVAFTVTLASPATAERLCRPLEINYSLSCHAATRSVVNDARWRAGAESYAGDLASYRLYVVNHEVGHALGHPHQQCPAAGRLAPVMVQQTKGIGACRPNPWPYP